MWGQCAVCGSRNDVVFGVLPGGPFQGSCCWKRTTIVNYCLFGEFCRAPEVPPKIHGFQDL